MTTLLTINITNDMPELQQLYVFQQPAVCSGGGMVYTNALFSMPLLPNSESGAVLIVQMDAQPYAGLQQAPSTPIVGLPSGFAPANLPIALATPGGSALDGTVAVFQPLSLSTPESEPGVPPGAFRITSGYFEPPEIYNLGSAVQVNGEMVLSSFVQANPQTNTDCQPIPKFYVQTGSYAPGTVVNFYEGSIGAALCDFTGGHSVINVTLNADGTWTTQILE